MGEENRTTVNSRGNLAVALLSEGKFAGAEADYKGVLKLMEHALGMEHPDTLDYTAKFASALTRQNKKGEAKELAREMEELARRKLGPDNAATAGYAKLSHDLEAAK